MAKNKAVVNLIIPFYYSGNNKKSSGDKSGNWKLEKNNVRMKKDCRAGGGKTPGKWKTNQFVRGPFQQPIGVSGCRQWHRGRNQYRRIQPVQTGRNPGAEGLIIRPHAL